MDPEALDYYSLDQSEKEKNLTNAFEIAEQKLGIPKLLDPEDLLSGNADERAVILYSSMFFHAFIADEEKRKLVEQKKSIGEQIKELKEALERERAEKERLIQEREQSVAKAQRDFSDKDSLIARLRAKIKQLMEEIEFLKKRALSDSELRAILESKIKTLQDLINAADSIEASLVGFSEAELLDWIQKMTSGYNNVNVENFSDSFNNGMALAALVHAMDPNAIDFESLDPNNASENVAKALKAAQDKLEIPASIDGEDLAAGKADESEVVTYTAQFLRKYVAEHGSSVVPPAQKTDRSLSSAAGKARVGGSKKFTKEDLLAWAKRMTEDYDNVDIKDFKNSFSDGLAIAALIHSLEPNAIDFASLSPENAEENLNKALQAAEAKLGIPITISAADLLNKTATENEVAAYTGQFYQKYLAESDLFGNPNVGKVGATPNPTAGSFPEKLGLSGSKFSPEDLLNWVKRTTDGYPNVDVQSFKDSFNDGMAFSALLHAMDPSSIDFDSLDPKNTKDNINRVLNIAEKKFGIPKLLNADDLVNGKANEADVIAYNAQFFEKFLEDSGLFASARGAGVHGNKTAETDLLKWAQKITKDYPGVNVKNFTDSFNDGLAFSAIVNSIDANALDFSSLNPENTKENVANVLAIAEQKLGVPRILSADDLVNGTADERDIIAYNAKLFSKYLDEVVLNNDSKYAPEDLLNWLKKMTEGYDNVNVDDFKNSFSDGMALSALIHSMDPSALDFNSLNPKDKKANLSKALAVAEQKFGIPKFSDAEALLNGSADEADVIAYTSKFLDKYIAEAGKYGVAGSKTRSADPYAPENSLLDWAKKVTADYDNVDVSNWKHSFADGLAFSAIMDSIKPGCIDFKSLDPAEAKDNLLAAFAVAEKEFGIPRTLNADDVLDGECDERDIQNYTAKLFEKYLEAASTSKAPFSKDDLLNWAQKTTADYDNVDVKDFTNSFKDGLALAALVHAIDPSAIDYDSLTSANAQDNVNAALAAAERKFGIPKSLDAAAVANGSASESDVVAYTGELFKRYVKEAGKFGKFGTSAENSLDRATQGHVTDDSERQRLLDELERRKNQLLAEIDALEKGLQNEIALRKKMADEIDFLKKQAASADELRSVLESKIDLLQSLIDGSNNTVNELSEQQHKLSSELDQHKKRGEELGAKNADLEQERNSLLTDAEEKARRLRELEERRKRLLDELAELQRRVQEEMNRRKEQAAEIARLKSIIENMTQKQIVQSQAYVGLDTLKKNLEDHLEDLYRWRDLNDVEMKEDVEEFDLSKVIADCSNKSFEEQLSYLDGRLQEENRNLSRIIKLQDDKDYLNDVVIKSGWLVMKGHKDWKKRWFRLAGNRLSFYEDDTSDDIAGSIQLDQGCDVVRHKAVKEDENSSKKVWPLKVTVGDRKLFVRAATKKERHSWFAAISSKIAHLNYSKHCEEKSERPDTRLVGVLNAASAPHLDVSNRPITEGVVAALVKGVPGRDELESLNLQKTGLSNEQFNTLSEVLEKLSGIKQLNISNNKVDSSIGARFIAALKADSVTDIDISGNNLDDAFLSQVAPFLKSCSKLNTLNLSGCQFSASGIEALVQALVDSEVVLEDLMLSNNKLGDSGVAALVPLFAKKTFKRVQLAGNCVGDSGAEALAGALGSSSVEEIDLSNNSVTGKGAVALKSLMESNDHLINLNLSSNAVVSDEASAALLAPTGLKISSLTFSR